MDKVKTKYGYFTACSDASDLRKKYRCPVEYHQNGNVRSIYLQETEEVTLPEGRFQAELMTFYEDGNIKRLFPLYGQLSSYWGVEDEIVNAPEYVFTIGEQELKIRPQCIYFYPSGKIRSITLWPEDSITVNTSKGPVNTKLGIEVYEDKKIRSIEPSFGTIFKTEYGDAKPFMVRKHMLHSEDASARFDEEGNLISFATLQTYVEADGKIYKAGDYRSPLIIYLGKGTVGLRGANNLNVWFDTKHTEVTFS